MKITIYELLGLIKDGKTPNFIYKNNTYTYDENTKTYLPSFMGLWKIYAILNDEVEIIENEFIDIEELSIFEHNNSIETNKGAWTGRNLDKALAYKINELIKNQKVLINKLKEESK